MFRWLWFALFVLACSAPDVKPTQHEDRPGKEAACEKIVAEGGDQCTYDSECGICRDGKAMCGKAMHVNEIAARGYLCKQKDPAQCEYARARCCGGRCVIAPN